MHHVRILLAASASFLVLACGASQEEPAQQTRTAPRPGSSASSSSTSGGPATPHTPLPAAPVEVCGNTVDEDRDGALNNGCPCTREDFPQQCSKTPALDGVGVCHAGWQRCVLAASGEGHWSVCDNARGPSGESCDGHDNDCDGEVDNHCKGNELATLHYTRTNSLQVVATQRIIPASQGRLLNPPVQLLTAECVTSEVKVDLPMTDAYAAPESACAPPPPDCLPDQLLDYDANGWACRACDLLVLYGGIFGDQVQCASQPTLSCGDLTQTFSAASRDWVCDELCDNGLYDQVSFNGVTMCIPC